MPSTSRPGPSVPLAPALAIAGALLAGSAGWIGILALIASGPVGLSALAGMVLLPAAILAAQAWRMNPEARRPLQVPMSDRGPCPVTGLPCEGVPDGKGR